MQSSFLSVFLLRLTFREEHDAVEELIDLRRRLQQGDDSSRAPQVHEVAHAAHDRVRGARVQARAAHGIAVSLDS